MGTDRPTDRPTNRPTDQPTDGRTKRGIELRARDKGALDNE